MKLKLPPNFGGLSIDGQAITLKPDKKGIVSVKHEVAHALLSHGAKTIDGDDEPEAGEGEGTAAGAGGEGSEPAK